MNGKLLYALYLQKPPSRTRGAAHVAAYWDGYEGRPNKFPKTSYGWWAYKAGTDNRKKEDKMNDAARHSPNVVPKDERGTQETAKACAEAIVRELGLEALVPKGGVTDKVAAIVYQHMRNRREI